MLSVQIKLAAWSWTESATCSGKRSTKSGVINISAAMSVTSTSCPLPSSIFLLLLFILSGGTKKEAEISHRITWSLAKASKVDAAPGWTAAPPRRSHPVTAAPLHLSLQVTAAPRHLSHLVTVAPLHLIRPMTAVPLPLSRLATVAPVHPKTEHSRRHISRGALRSTAARQSQREVRKWNCK